MRPAEADKATAPPPSAGLHGLRGRQILLVCVLLTTVTFLPYLRTWWYDLVYLDDVFFVREGRWFFEDWGNLPKVFTNHVWEFFGQESSLYRPLLLLPRFFEMQLFGASPGPYHILNTALHWAAVSVLFVLLLRLLGDFRASLAGTVLFALHPAHVPTVAWIEGYNNSMTALFVLGTVLLVLISVQTGRTRWALLSGLTFLLALLTKESAVGTPLLAFGVVWLWRRRNAPRVEAVPVRLFAVTATAWAIAFGTWFVLRWHAIPETPELESDYVLASVGRGWPGLLLYWGKVFLPFNLVPLPTLRDSSLHFGIAAAALYAIAIWRSHDENRRVLVLGALWFVLLISPSLLVSRLETPSGAMFREDRMYQASIGAFIAVAFLVRGALEKYRTPTFAAVAACAALWLVLGQARMETYANGMAYWTEAVKGSPNLSLAHQLLAVMHHREGDFRREKEELLKALAINPRLEGLNNDIGTMFIREGNYTEADKFFLAELALYPDSDKAHYNRALLHYHTRNYPEAVRSVESYLRLTKDVGDSPLRRNAQAMLADIERATHAPSGAQQVTHEAAARSPGATT